LVNLDMSWQAAEISAVSLAVAAVAAWWSRRPRLMAAAGFAREAAVLLALFGLWQLVGGVGRMSPDGALSRGEWLWHAERVLHMPSETVLQRAFLPHPLIVQAFNLY